VIEVLDRGPGIAPDGAGILIAQAAIERFGGTVAISERRSGGTCVRIELPGFRLSGERDEDCARPRAAGR
jgi:signal transduction histidine kinase